MIMLGVKLERHVLTTGNYLRGALPKVMYCTVLTNGLAFLQK